MLTRLFVPSLALVCFAGCGGATSDRPATYAVTGVVTLDGKPVEGATVTFNPESRDGTAAFGRTGADGTYQLTTFEASDGALPGDYIVTVTKYSGGDTGTSSAPTEEGGEPADYIPPEAPGYQPPPPPQNALPQKYSAMHTSDLRAVVQESGENVVNVELLSN